MSVVTRFPPSPTGYLHVGGARTALFNWLFARQQGGKMILRIEDTDRERSTEESVQAILDGMAWLELSYDEGPYYQTQRFDRYREVVQQLLDDGHAYHCYCSREELDEMREAQKARKEKPRYDGRCRHRSEPRPGVDPVVRFKNPQDGAVEWLDLVKGPVSFANAELDDLIIARSDGTPTYNLTVVVDDIDMGMTHVIRGDDHVNNTPRQINIFKALGADLPVYGHVPMILGTDGARLSKRHGAVSVMQYREEGFLPQAMRNYLARLGWSHGDQEVFSMEELVDAFDITKVQKAAARFDTDKLVWLNHHYIKGAKPQELVDELTWHLDRRGVSVEGGPDLAAVIASQQERCKTLVEMADKSVFFYAPVTEYVEKDARKHLKDTARPVVAALIERFEALPAWEAEPVHAVVHAVAEEMELGLGKVAQPIRVAVAGMAVSPPIDVTLTLLGRERTVQRLRDALEFIDAKADA